MLLWLKQQPGDGPDRFDRNLIALEIANLRGDLRNVARLLDVALTPGSETRAKRFELKKWFLAYAHWETTVNMSRQAFFQQLFDHAAQLGLVHLLAFLLRTPIDPAAHDNAAIQHASLFGHVDVVRLLLQYLDTHPGSAIDPAADENWAIRGASRYGHVEVVRLLLQDRDTHPGSGIDPAAISNWAIRVASCNGHVEVVRLLLEDRDTHPGSAIDPAADNNWAIQGAAGNGHVEVVRLLLEDRDTHPGSGIDLAASDNWAIRGASGNGHVEVVRLLLEYHDTHDDRGIDPSLALPGAATDEIRRLLQAEPAKRHRVSNPIVGLCCAQCGVADRPLFVEQGKAAEPRVVFCGIQCQRAWYL